MSFLLDTDICSAFLKNDPLVVSRVMLHYGGLHVSVVTAGELWTWALREKAPPAREQGVSDFLQAAQIELIDARVAWQFARLRSSLLDRGRTVAPLDLLNAAVAITQGLTLVTHNTRDYRDVPGLAMLDWMTP